MKVFTLLIAVILSMTISFAQSSRIPQAWSNVKPYEESKITEGGDSSEKNDLKSLGELQPARFLSTDRFADKYPSMNPYQYTANNPIVFIDVNGDSIDVSSLTQEQFDEFVSEIQNIAGYNVLRQGNMIVLGSAIENFSGNASATFTKGFNMLAGNAESNVKLAINSNLSTSGRYDAGGQGRQNAGGTLNLKSATDISSYEGAHELFHGVQQMNYDMEQTAAVEFEADQFAEKVTYESQGVFSAQEGSFSFEYLLNGNFNFELYNQGVRNTHNRIMNIPEYTNFGVGRTNYSTSNPPFIYNFFNK
jgi:hypothetical protein